jgi:hypothetical protein
MSSEEETMKGFTSGSFSEPDAGGVVAASDGVNVYEVWQFKGSRREWECTCTGYRTFNKQCKHISEVRDTVKTGKKGPNVITFFG